MALFIEIKSADGLASRTRLEAGNNRFTVRLGDSYRIFDDQTGIAPPGMAVKRVDSNLIVDGLGKSEVAAGGQPTTVEFAEFYSVCSAGSPCELVVDQGPGSPSVAITPGTQPIGALADGSFVLYDPNYADNAPATPSLGDDATLRYALYGLGGAAVLGLAAGGGGGGGGGDSDGGGQPDGSLQLTSSTFTNSRTPTISGQGEPGAKVTVRIDTDGDGVPNVTYGTTVAADFTWSVNLATAVPESGALPSGGLPDASNVGITSTTAGGSTSLPTFVLAFDNTPPAQPVINPVATDDVVNANERSNGFLISGTAEPGATVVVSAGAQVLASVLVQDNGTWQTDPLVGSAVPADGAYQLSAVVQDRAGNLSTAGNANLRIDTAPPVLADLNIAGGDQRVSIAEAGQVAFTGRTDPGAAVQVQWNGGTKTAVANGQGGWSVSFTGAEVPASAGADVPYSITATNAIGNSIVQPGQVFVDTQAPPPPVFNAVETDNVVSLAERADGVPVSGQAEPNAQVQVTWGGSTLSTIANGAGSWGVQFAAGAVPQITAPGGPSTITATAIDSVGNRAAAQQGVTLEQPFPAATVNVVEGNNIVNAAEAADGVLLSGTVAAGLAGVNVTWGAFAGTAAIAGTTWSLAVPAAQVPPDGNSEIAVTNTGPGGGATARLPVLVDRVGPAAPGVNPVTGDDVINLADRLGNVVISGGAEANSTVNIVFGNVSKTASVVGGVWSVEFTPLELPPGPGVATLTVTATDAAGNVGPSGIRLIPVEGILGASDLPAVAGQPLTVSDLLQVDQPASPSALPTPIAAAAPVTYASAALDALLVDEPNSGRLS
jgi:hypothetical protein